MDSARFDSFTRALTATPSRRTVTRAFVGLAAAPLLGPLLGVTGAGAKGKKGGRKKKQRQKDTPTRQHCGPEAAWCEAGTFSACCSQQIDPGEDDSNEICTAGCGCCDRGFSQCCPARDWAVCCRNGERCCYAGTDLAEAYCCPPNTTCCGGVCCPSTQVCCSDGSCVAFQSVCDYYGL